MHATFDAFLPYWRARVETACFWFGVRGSEGRHTATTLVLPRLYQTSGNYSVVPDTLGDVARALRAQGLTNLAQVHTHPSGWVGHSLYDDAHAYSTQEGALSLVWPHYGRTLDVELSSVGIHELRNGAWVRLNSQEAAQRISLVDSVADFRWAPNAGGIADEE
ncbi:Mov34/MPN/PAD-1 family protein [Corallococcus sp. M34]|nr:Mov34/MPN/PAD-1 family protein [Citreicoccus inhibens]